MKIAGKKIGLSTQIFAAMLLGAVWESSSGNQ